MFICEKSLGLVTGEETRSEAIPLSWFSEEMKRTQRIKTKLNKKITFGVFWAFFALKKKNVSSHF